MRVVIVAGAGLAGGPEPPSGDLEPRTGGLDRLTGGPHSAQTRSADLLVAVDGGAEVLNRAGILPGLLVGDMDSITAATRQSFEAQGVEVVLLNTAKDESDTEAALRLVVSRGATDITVYGALGGPRLDHMVGNLLLLTAPWLDGVGVRMVDDRHEAFLAHRDVVFAGELGDVVSLLALTPRVDYVRTSGLAFPLVGEPLLQWSTRSVSNAMLGSEARVTHGAGTLLVIHYRGRET